MNIMDIQDLLATNDTAVKNALLILHNNQTEDEQRGEYTSRTNGIGFNKFDAKLGSSLAKRISSGRDLTDRQLAAGRRMSIKYARQLAQAANNLTRPLPKAPGEKKAKDRNPWNVPVIIIGKVMSDTYSHVMVRFQGKEDLVSLPKKNIMWDGNVFVVPLQLAKSYGLDRLQQCTVEVR